MTTQQLLNGLAVLAQAIPTAGPYISAALKEVSAGLNSEDDLAVLDAALAAMPSEAQIDAARAKIYAEELAKKLAASGS